MTTKHELQLPETVNVHLRSLAEASYPYEGCGLLIGERTGRAWLVREVTRATNLNVERAHDRYELDPADLLRAEDRASSIGAEVLGVWHTHPDHPAEPSETDRAAAWEGWSYVIVSVRHGRVHSIRSWRLSGDVFQEESISS